MKTKQQSSKRCFQKLGSATDSIVVSGLVAMKHFLILIELLPYLGRAHFYGLKMNLELDSRVNITRGVLVTVYECKQFSRKEEWGHVVCLFCLYSKLSSYSRQNLQDVKKYWIFLQIFHFQHPIKLMLEIRQIRQIRQ